MNQNNCVECFFYSKNTSSALPFFFLDGEALSRDSTVKHLGVNFSSFMIWSAHIDTAFIKCLKLLFYSDIHRSLFMAYRNGYTDYLTLLWTAKQRLDYYLKELRLLPSLNGVAYMYSCKVLISEHCNSFKRLSFSISNDPLHLLDHTLQSPFSNLLRARTCMQITALLVNPLQYISLLYSEPSCWSSILKLFKKS